MLVIKKKYVEDILKEASLAQKEEICGLFSGRAGKVLGRYPLKNVSTTPEQCYLMDPQEQLRVLKDIRQKGEELVGIYHSHPASAAYPSARDVELAFYPEAVHLIIAAKEKKIGGFAIIDGKISPVELIYE